MPPRRIALVWENLGPSHFDRINACAAAGFQVTCVEFHAASQAYRWEQGEACGAQRITLERGERRIGGLRLVWHLCRSIVASRAQTVFLCHYQSVAVFLSAVFLRLAGRRVITMIDSKFDDYPRHIMRELGKAFLMTPYAGAIAGSRRSAEYLHLLGFIRRPVFPGFDSLDIARIQRLAGDADLLPHEERDFLIVARLVAKKNLAFALKAYAAWHQRAVHPRRLRIIGYGEDERELRELASHLGISEAVLFLGEQHSAQVYQAMRQALCLILPSKEEQFGLVIVEALAVGLPVLVSANAGAVDQLIDNGVNGWVIDPERPEALIAAMTRLADDEAAWQAASAAAMDSSPRGDVGHFVAAVAGLVRH